MNHLLGAHTSTTGGVGAAVDLASKLGFTAMQIFSKNNTRWHQRPFSEKEIYDFKTKLKNSNIKFVCVHDSYLINLCANNLEFKMKSDNAFLDEIERCHQLGIEYLNFHPGAHCGAGEQEGIKIIAEALNIAHEKTKDYKVSSMLEATAGQGSAVGYRFEHLQEIIDLVEVKERMSVCIDTAHIFAAGYDIRTPEVYEKTMKEFDEIVGFEKLKCFHMNDSKKSLGSRVDRHDHIGKGLIGKEGFSNIMNDKRLEHIPKILETPKGKEHLEDVENIKVLKSLIR
ncbi:MAG: deoxyribonuclease IV [Ignavibacteria bacterium]|nr:deoxyribonuclease IV [Ignavibacteria bacterium]